MLLLAFVSATTLGAQTVTPPVAAAPSPPVEASSFPADPQRSVETPAAGAPAEQVLLTGENVELRGAPGSGLTADFGEAFSLSLKTRFQLRYQFDAAAPDDEGERELDQAVSIGTARIWIGGHVFQRELTYMIQLAVAGRDYRDGATSPVYDAYLDWKPHRDLSLRLGQYFVPFDRLRTVREFALQMADRPRPVQELTLDRDVGLTLYSDHFLADDSPLAVRVGVFGGGGTNLTNGKTPGALVVGRLEVRPLGEIDDDSEGDLKRHPAPALALGVAAAHNWNTNRTRSTTGAVFSSGVVDYTHAALDLVFKWRGFALQAEALWRLASQDSWAGAEPGALVYSQAGRGWIAQASYILPFPLEVVGRLTRVDPDASTDPVFVDALARTGQEVGAGLNYYLNGHKFKVQTDWIARMPTNFDFNQAEHAAHVLLDVTL